MDLGNAAGLVQASYAQAQVARLTAEISTHQTAGARYLTLSRRWRAAAITAMTAVALGSAFAVGYKFRTTLLSNWGGVTGLAIVVVAAITVLIFDLFHYSSGISRWIRSRLSP